MRRRRHGRFGVRNARLASLRGPLSMGRSKGRTATGSSQPERNLDSGDWIGTICRRTDTRHSGAFEISVGRARADASRAKRRHPVGRMRGREGRGAWKSHPAPPTPRRGAVWGAFTAAGRGRPAGMHPARQISWPGELRGNGRVDGIHCERSPEADGAARAGTRQPGFSGTQAGHPLYC